MRKRLNRVELTLGEVSEVIRKLPEDNPYRSLLLAHKIQLEEAKALLEIDMTHAAMRALDRRASKVAKSVTGGK